MSVKQNVSTINSMTPRDIESSLFFSLNTCFSLFNVSLKLCQKRLYTEVVNHEKTHSEVVNNTVPELEANVVP